ncbi:MAG: hypothetical protein WCR58_00935 [Bacteroidales bacterium]|nr:hypothetical protein [Bacteroidales bacterium]
MRTLSVLLLLITVFTSCSSLMTSSADAAKASERTGNYAKALSMWEKQIEQEEKAGTASTTIAYDRAGQAALHLGDTVTAEKHFKMAVYYTTASAETWSFLANYYQFTDQLSPEVMALEGLLENFPQHELTHNSIVRLFTLYYETAQWENAMHLWQQIPEVHQDIDYLNRWFDINKTLQNTDSCNQIATRMLTLKPDHSKALEWQAVQAYNLGETRYQQEMKAYENNKTHAQYAKLLKGLDQATIDYKKSLKLFEDLYHRYPHKRYALYIGNIYARFGDEAKASKYHTLSQ